MSENSQQMQNAIQQPEEKPDSAQKPMLVIEPSPRWSLRGLGEVWQYRELLWSLTLRDIKIRHKQTVLGMSWTILQPFLFVLIFAFFFRNLIGVRTADVPYPVFCFAGLLPWYFFVNALNKSMGAMVANGGLISKIYFPRIILVLAAVISSTLDYVVTLLVLMALMVYYHVAPHFNLVYLPLVMFWAVLISFGLGLWTSVLNARFRDVGNIVQLILQTGMFISPIAYPVSMVPESTRFLYALNPMVGIIETMRWSLYGHTGQVAELALIAGVETAVVLVTGLLFFQHKQRVLVDII